MACCRGHVRIRCAVATTSKLSSSWGEMSMCSHVVPQNHTRMGPAFVRFSEAAEATENHSLKLLQEGRPYVPWESTGWGGGVNRKKKLPEVKQHAANPWEHWATGQLCHSPRFVSLGEWHKLAFLTGSSGARAKITPGPLLQDQPWYFHQLSLFRMSQMVGRQRIVSLLFGEITHQKSQS